MTGAAIGIHHVRIPVSDLTRSTAFWCENFDMAIDFDFPGDAHVRGRALSNGETGGRVVLWVDEGRAEAGGDFVVAGLSVPSTRALEELRDRLGAAGIRHGGIQPALVESKLVGIVDPDGNLVNVYVDAP